MPLKLKAAYFPTQNCLIYKGQLEGKVTNKNKVFLGKLGKLPTLPKNKRYNVRVRGSDVEGNRYLPLQCRGRTDGAGDLYIRREHAPQLDRAMSIEPDDPHAGTVPPEPTKLSLVINNTLRRKK